MSVNIKNLIKKDATLTEEVPGYPGFMVTLAYPGRDTLANIRKACVTQKLQRGGKVEEVLDEDKFMHKFVEATIKGWSGFKLSYLQELAVVDTGDLDSDQEVDFSIENAVALMQNSPTFDDWVTNTVTEMQNFTKAK